MLTLKDWQGSHLQWLSLLLPHPHPGLPVEDRKKDEIEDEDVMSKTEPRELDFVG